MQKSSDLWVSSRLTAEIVKVIKANEISDRCLHNVFDGGVEMLQSCEFNASDLLTGTLFAPYEVTID